MCTCEKSKSDLALQSSSSHVELFICEIEKKYRCNMIITVIPILGHR